MAAVSRSRVWSESRRWDPADAVSFLIPFLRLVSFDGIGRLYGTDLAALGIIAILAPSRSGWLRERSVAAFLIACGMFLAGAVASDIYNISAFQDWARGWSKIVLFALSFIALTLLFDGSMRRLVLFMAGYAASIVIETTFLPSEFAVIEIWKFGYGAPLTLLVILAAETDFVTQRLGRAFGIGCVMAIAAVSFGLNARSLFGLAAAASLVGLVKMLIDPGRTGMRLTWLLFGSGLVAASVLAYGLVEIQNAAALSGALGPEAEMKAGLQSSGDLGLLLGGRTESLVSTQAIADSPIFGHGSWARNISYIGLLVDLLTVNGGFVEPSMLEEDLIPSHSFLLGAWVESGILGAAFWAYVMWMSLCACKGLLAVPVKRPMLIAFLVIELMWNILFSPFGADRRFSVPIPIILALTMIEAERRQSAAGTVAAARSSVRRQPSA